MKRQDHRIKGVVIGLVVGAAMFANAQGSVNQWRGSVEGADWMDRYKWKLMHTPTGDEAVHFREATSVVTVNSSVYLNNGMHLYGEELSLRGNGNINLQNPVPHQRTINVPASATGFANLTLNDNLSLNGRLALSAKGFGTSASKGSVTLKDRSTVTGVLSIGNDGNGTGQVYVKGNSTYRITGLELETRANAGGSAEIHVLGGTVRIETQENPFDVFLADTSRKLIVGDTGTVRIEHNLHPAKKKDAIKKMIVEKRLVAAPGCRLLPPVIQDNMMIIRAEDERNDNSIKTQKALLAAIDRIEVNSTGSVASSSAKPKLESLLKTMQTTQPSQAPVATAPAQPAAPAMADAAPQGPRVAGYIVFFGTVLLVLRRSPKDLDKEG
ncbi:hypothetical protein [Pontiella desulfatans]|nr:hypothetical protein [Pontiella desulfatans]